MTAEQLLHLHIVYEIYKNASKVIEFGTTILKVHLKNVLTSEYIFSEFF